MVLALSGYHPSVNAAPAPVEELGREGRSGNASTTANVQRNVAAVAVAENDPYYKLQLIQEELRQLRGMLEEQGHQLEQLKSRQQEDYLDLDGRLSAAAGGASTGSSSTTSGDNDLPPPPPMKSKAAASSGVVPAPAPARSAGSTRSGGGNEAAETAAYDQAYGLLTARKTDQAKIAFNKFLVDYPNSQYVANAQYWLGEVYLLNNELTEAETAFRTVVDRYPAHRKVNDATFKLGKVYHLQNKPDKARVMLERVAKGSDSAARLAQDYLLAHF